MPASTDIHVAGTRTRSILSPNGDRVQLEGERRRTEEPAEQLSGVRWKVSADSSSDSSSSSCSDLAVTSSTKNNCPRIRVVKKGIGFNKPAKIVPDGLRTAALCPHVHVPVTRCDWITPNSEPIYTSFHDKEWGVPVHDDMKLFELLVLSQALGEFSMQVILSKRAIFRRLFDEFDPTSVANLDEERLLSIRVHGNTLLSEPKLRAVVENAKQLLKIQQEYGSFSTYCWNFVNHKPIQSGFRHARKVQTKTPKSELISKDLMQRGFGCVGPTVVYSFMQMAGIVNDHLFTCFRYNECGHNAGKNPTALHEKAQILKEAGKKKAETMDEK